MSAMVSTVNLCRSLSGLSGMVSVTITSSSALSLMRSYAGPESTGWVMAARTLFAPRDMSMSAAMQIVPAVSIMSSTIRMLRPSTSPMAVILPTTLALARSLCEMMIGVPSSFA